MEGGAVRDPEQVWRLGLQLYDAGMAAAETRRLPGAVREQAARLRSLATTASPAVAAELRWLAAALDAELRLDAWRPLAEAEELVGVVWATSTGMPAVEAARLEEVTLQRLTLLRQANPDDDRPLRVLTEWVRLRRRRREQGPGGAPTGVVSAP
jgi:hypothetical protein